MRIYFQSLIVAVTLIVSLDHSTAGSVSLTWNPSPDTNVVGYKIYYGAASQVYTTNIVVGDVTNTTVNGLADGTTYYFAATSYDAAGDESVFSNEASYDVTNSPPTLNSIANLSIKENAGGQNVNLTGIASGNPGQTQTLTVTAASSNPTLIPTPAVNYFSPNTTGTLTFAPALNAYGTATITVTVNNGGAGNNIVTQIFTVTVNPVNQPPALNPIASLTISENTSQQTVYLAGITSGVTTAKLNLKITAASSRRKLIPTPAVHYTSPDTTGTLTFTPAPNAYGVATITVTVNNGLSSSNIVTQSFTVTVLSSAQAAIALAAPTNGPGNTAFILTPQDSDVSGQFTFTVLGSSGSPCVVQASTDLVDWTPIQTNLSPFTVVDTNADAFTQRFYRAVLSQ